MWISMFISCGKGGDTNFMPWKLNENQKEAQRKALSKLAEILATALFAALIALIQSVLTQLVDSPVNAISPEVASAWAVIIGAVKNSIKRV